MTEQSSNNKRIAKNTILLYFRMLLLMIISLYTSRVNLSALGVDNYGIYNVVGGVVAMFSVLSGSLSSSNSRFITYELGTGNSEKLKKIFSSALSIQIFLAFFIAILIEVIGVWFLNNKMVIPANRIVAANWVLQFSILTFAINLISVPYNATIIAHEKMSAFAYISIIEAAGKLGIAFAISISPVDKLIFYAGCLTFMAIFIRFIYGFYCKRHFEECIYNFVYDKDLLKSMFGFAGWNFFGSIASVLITQGINILCNVFFGVAINAARGIANQVNATIMQFVNNFTMAINPQITKSYAAKDHEYMYKLIFRGAKYSFFLVMFFAIPCILESKEILSLWLKEVPEHTVSFLRLIILVSMVQVLSNTMITAMMATGNIKKYQIIVGGTALMGLPLSYFAFKVGLPAEMGYIVVIILYSVLLVCRIFLLKNMVGMSVIDFFKEVLLKTIPVSIAASLFPIIICIIMKESFIRFLIVCAISLIASIVTIYYIGLVKNERSMILSKMNKLISKFR